MGAPENTPLRVQHIAFDLVRARCADHGIREGDELTCIGSTMDHLLVQLPTRRQVSLERELGMFIGVEPIGRAARAS